MTLTLLMSRHLIIDCIRMMGKGNVFSLSMGSAQGTYPSGQGTYPPASSGWGRGVPQGTYPSQGTYPPAKVPTLLCQVKTGGTPRSLPLPHSSGGQDIEYLICCVRSICLLRSRVLFFCGVILFKKAHNFPVCPHVY